MLYFKDDLPIHYKYVHAESLSCMRKYTRITVTMILQDIIMTVQWNCFNPDLAQLHIVSPEIRTPHYNFYTVKPVYSDHFWAAKKWS